MTLNLADLGMPGETLKAWSRLLTQSRGLLVVTGFRGSGLTTTLQASLRQLGPRPDVCLVQGTGPSAPGVWTLQTDLKRGLGYAQAFLAAMDRAPRVVAVDELNDRTVAQLALEAAGERLVLAGFPGPPSAAGVSTRLVELGLDVEVLASRLQGVLAQELLPRLCEKCREPHLLEPAAAAALGLPSGATPVFRPRGCPDCAGAGCLGSIGVFELLLPGGPGTGFLPLREEVLRSVVNGQTTVSAAAQAWSVEHGNV